MLRFLRIQHFAVIDSVEVEFDPGPNVLTGETGAGKSILVEAVGLLLGGRASGDLVRTGEDAAAIEAIFESGVFKPVEEVKLPEGQRVMIFVRPAEDSYTWLARMRVRRTRQADLPREAARTQLSSSAVDPFFDRLRAPVFYVTRGFSQPESLEAVRG